MAFEARRYTRWPVNFYLGSSHSGNMSVNRVLIRDEQNPLFGVGDKDFAPFFSNIEDLLIGMYHN